MEFGFDNNIPIYLQLVTYLKIDIISGRLASGQRLPSVRDLAMQMKVNPNTMQKALQELENTGLIYTERTNGKFVSEDKDKIALYRQEYAKEISNRFFEDMKKIGYSKEETKQFIDHQGGNNDGTA